jgi:hypothetical protein
MTALQTMTRAIQSYLDRLCTQFQCDRTELDTFWTRYRTYAYMKKLPLQRQCHEHGFPIHGTRKALLERLMGVSCTVSSTEPITASKYAIQLLIEWLVQQYEIDRLTLHELWESITLTCSSESSSETEIDYESLDKSKLKDLCRERGYPVSGPRITLIGRLTGTIAVQPRKSRSKSKTPPPMKSIFEKLLKAQETLTIRRNVYGNYEDIETGFVFDPTTELVIGRQQPSGEVTELTVEDIEQCRSLGWSYQLPDPLMTRNEWIQQQQQQENPFTMEPVE